MAEFNIDELKKMVSLGQYTNGAKYIRSFRFNDPIQRRQMNKIAETYETEGRDFEEMLAAVGPNEDLRNRLLFMNQKNSGFWGNNSAERSEYANKYLDLVNNLGSKDGVQADYIYINLTNDIKDKYKDTFVQGMYNDEVGEGMYGNGYKVKISKLLEEDNYDRFEDLFMLSSVPNVSSPFVSIPGAINIAAHDKFSDKPLASLLANNSGDFYAVGLTDKDKVIGPLNWDNTTELHNFLDEMRETQNSMLEEQQGTSYVADINVQPYMCKAHLDLLNAISTGQVSREDGAWWLSQIKDAGLARLRTVSLTSPNYTVFATQINDETMNFNQLNDSKELVDLTQELRTAIKEGRVEFQAAASGGRTGTLITISATADKEGNFVGNAKGSRSIFVTGLFDDDAKDIMNEDIDARVYVKHNSHIQNNHKYELGDGSYIMNFQGDGSAYKHEMIGDEEVITYMPTEEVEADIRKEEMIKAAEYKLIDDDTEVYATKVKNYTPDQIAAIKYEDRYGYGESELESISEQYATQIMYYLLGIQSEEELQTDEMRNSLHYDIRDIKDRLIKRLKQ